MKQFLITAAGVFAGLLVFLIGVPFVLISMALSATIVTLRVAVAGRPLSGSIRWW